MSAQNNKQLVETAKEIRKLIIRMLVEAKSGHSAGPLGAADLFTALYFGDLVNYRSDDPYWKDRDRIVLSCGHYAPVIYATLAKAGFFTEVEALTLRKFGSRLQGHVVRHAEGVMQLPGIENTGGPLGQGISVAVGMALAGKLDRKKWRVICISSDGEQEEGQTWEAYECAAKYKLGNLTFVIDRNNIQISGNVDEVMPIEPLKNRLESFGLRVLEMDGHNFDDIKGTMGETDYFSDQPKAIIMKTTPGKGVDFMEGKFEWHGKVPSEEEGKLALLSLDN